MSGFFPSAYLGVAGCWRALWEKNDPGALCQNKPPFLSLALGRAAPPEGNLLAPRRDAPTALPPAPDPDGVFVPLK